MAFCKMVSVVNQVAPSPVHQRAHLQPALDDLVVKTAHLLVKRRLAV